MCEKGRGHVRGRPNEDKERRGYMQQCNSHVAAEYSLWGVDVHRSRTRIISNEDKEIGENRYRGEMDGERKIVKQGRQVRAQVKDGDKHSQTPLALITS